MVERWFTVVGSNQKKHIIYHSAIYTFKFGKKMIVVWKWGPPAWGLLGIIHNIRRLSAGANTLVFSDSTNRMDHSHELIWQQIIIGTNHSLVPKLLSLAMRDTGRSKHGESSIQFVVRSWTRWPAATKTRLVDGHCKRVGLILSITIEAVGGGRPVRPKCSWSIVHPQVPWCYVLPFEGSCSCCTRLMCMIARAMARWENNRLAINSWLQVPHWLGSKLTVERPIEINTIGQSVWHLRYTMSCQLDSSSTAHQFNIRRLLIVIFDSANAHMHTDVISPNHFIKFLTKYFICIQK